MSLTIELSPELETRLRAEATREGQAPEEFARRVRGGVSPARSLARPASSPSFNRPPAKRTGNPMLGRKVRHATYGVGTVVGVEGDDDDRRVSVSFPGRGTKKFVERYAQLEQM